MDGIRSGKVWASLLLRTAPFFTCRPVVFVRPIWPRLGPVCATWSAPAKRLCPPSPQQSVIFRDFPWHG